MESVHRERHRFWILLAVAFFAVWFFVGVSTYRSMGVPYDEGVMDSLGRDAYAYVTARAPWPENRQWRYHGAIVEIGIYALQEAFYSDAPLDLVHRIHLRHFLCFLLTFLSILLLYGGALRLFRHPGWALLPCVLFVLTPRFFAHAFYNSRDIPAMGAFTLSVLTLLWTLERPTVLRAALLGVTAGLTLSIRMPGLLLVPISLVALAVVMVDRRSLRSGIPQFLLVALAYVAAFVVATIACWPFLWSHPLQHFLEAYHFMGSSEPGAPSLGMPLWYVPFWMGVTIPTTILLFFSAGVVRAVRERDRALCVLAWVFFFPIVVLYVRHVVIFQEWRHLFFLYPTLLLLAVSGVRWTLRSATEGPTMLRWTARVALGLLVLQSVSSLLWMVRNRPFWMVYTSVPVSWVGSDVTEDYWGASYRQATEWILEHDNRVHIPFYSNENLALINGQVFDYANGLALEFRPPEHADTIVTRSAALANLLVPLHLFTVDGRTVVGVYRGPLTELPPGYSPCPIPGATCR